MAHGHFRSKMDGIQRAKRYHVCLKCRHNQHEIFDFCPVCRSTLRQHFASKTEFQRGMLLLTLQGAGTISGLKFQPRFSLVVKGRKIGTYVADAMYQKDGAAIYEDSKPVKFMDANAKIKIALFEALYGVTVTIPQQGIKPKSTPLKIEEV